MRLDKNLGIPRQHAGFKLWQDLKDSGFDGPVFNEDHAVIFLMIATSERFKFPLQTAQVLHYVLHFS